MRFHVTPSALVGMYLARFVSPRTGEDVTYLRVTFAGTVGPQHDRPLDHGIVRAVWMTYDELVACRDRHRSELVLQCVDDYRRGQRAPLDLLATHPSIGAAND